MYDAELAIAAALESSGEAVVSQHPFLGFGLTRADVWDWRTLWPALVTETRPDVVLVMVGPWDVRTLDVDGHPLAPGIPGWWQWYEPQVFDAVRLLTAGGARLLWVGAPFLADPDTDARIDALDEELQEVTTAAAQTWIDGATALAGPDGGYAEAVPAFAGTLVRLRKPDGVHLCPDGAVRVAEPVAAAIAAEWQVTPGPGWEAGPWRRDARYDDTHPGPGCADH